MNNLQKNIWRGRFFRYAPLLLWICVVLFLSTGQASMSQTSRFIRPLLEFLFPNTPDETLIIYHNYIRKCAHLTEYAILAFWAARAFSGSALNALRKYWHVFSFLLVLLVATTDETNQSFNQARTGSPRDVALDVCGGVMMILVFYLIINRKKKKSFE